MADATAGNRSQQREPSTHRLSGTFMTFEPQSDAQEILAEETYRAFSALMESRRARLNSIEAEMPHPCGSW
jgi:hypothetical protein